jgi:hypothetical protein
MTGVTSLVNNNSSQNLTFTGASALAGVTLNNVSGGNTTVTYASSAGVGGTQALTLTGNQSIAGGAASTITIGSASLGGALGLAQVDITTATSGSKLVDLVTGAPTITVAGDQSLSITNNLEAATKIDASANSGGVTVTVDSGANDVVVTGGTGNDNANFSNGWDKGDTYDGGDGTDTLGLLYGVATAIASTNTGTATNVEVLDITDVAGANGTIDMDNFAGVQKVILNGGITTGFTATIDDAVSGLEVEVDVDAAATGSLVVDLKTDGTADELTITLDRVGNVNPALGGNDVIASINVADAETVNFNVDDDSADGKGIATITSLTATDATKITVAGDGDLTITGTVDPATAILATLDASTMTGNLTIGGTNFASSGATIMLGSGADTLAFATASGADTITLGEGKDTVTYNAVAQSDSDTDTITDFVSGTDQLTFQFANPVLNFAGNKESFGQAQGALPGTGTAAGLSAVFQVDDQILWIDNDGNGTLDNKDFRIKLTGVTALTSADIGVSGSGASITLDAAGTTITTTTNSSATNSAVLTNFNDTITGSAKNANGSTFTDGLGTADSLVIDAASIVTDLGGTTVDLTNAAGGQNLDIDVNQIEKVTFNNVPNAGNINIAARNNGEDVTVNGADSALTITAVANGQDFVVANTTGTTASTILLGNFTTLTASLGAAADTINGIQTADANVNGGTGADNFVIASNAAGTGSNANNANAILNAAALQGATITGGTKTGDVDVLTYFTDANAAAQAALTLPSTITGIESFVANDTNATVATTYTIPSTVGLTTITATGGAQASVFSIALTAAQTLTMVGDAATNTTVNVTNAGAYTLVPDTNVNDITLANGTNTISITAANLAFLGDGAGETFVGGTGADTINLTTAAVAATLGAATTQGVTAVETVNMNGAGNQVLTTVDSNVAAAGTLTINNNTTGSLTFIGAAEADGKFVINNAASTTAGSQITGGQLADMITLSTSAAATELYHIDGNGTAAAASLITNYDTVTNFNADGDTMAIGNAGANSVTAYNVATAEPSTLVANIQAQIDANVAGFNAQFDVALITVAAGGAAGTYLAVADGANTTLTNADFFVKLVGLTGTLDTTDFVA